MNKAVNRDRPKNSNSSSEEENKRPVKGNAVIEKFKEDLKMSAGSLCSIQVSDRVESNHRIIRQLTEKEEQDRLKLSYAWKIARFSY